jgi:hypothetical protein
VETNIYSLHQILAREFQAEVNQPHKAPHSKMQYSLLIRAALAGVLATQVLAAPIIGMPFLKSDITSFQKLLTIF